MKNANQVLGLPDQRTYYNAVQLSLPVNTILALDQEDEVYSFLEAVGGVDFSKYVKPLRSNNTNSHDRGMLVRTMLFGYMNGVNSLSRLASLLPDRSEISVSFKRREAEQYGFFTHDSRSCGKY